MKEIQFIDGFLDKNIESKNIAYIQSYNKKEFDFLYRLNREMSSTEYLLDETISVTNDRDCYIVANFTTVHKSFQSVVILLERGLQDDALSLLRSIFEKVVYIKCAMNEILFLKVQINGITEKIADIKKVRKHDFKYRSVTDSDLAKKKEDLICAGKKLMDKIDCNKSYNGKNKYDLAVLAKDVDLEDMYQYVYPVLNKKIHSDMGEIMSKVNLNEEDAPYINLNPIFDDNYYYIETISTVVIILLELICAHFSFSQDNIENLNLEKKQIWNEV